MLIHLNSLYFSMTASSKKCDKSVAVYLTFLEFHHWHLQLTWVKILLQRRGNGWFTWAEALSILLLLLVSSAHRPRDTQKQYKQSHIMDSHNKLTLGSGWCSTQLMPVLIRAWKYYLGLAARSKKSILSQVINSALSDCSPIPGSSMSLSWLLPLKFSLWLALSCLIFHKKTGTCGMYTHRVYYVVFQRNNISRTMERLT